MSKLTDAYEFVKDCTTYKALLQKLHNNNIEHPEALAQALGLSGRGSKSEVVIRIVDAVQERKTLYDLNYRRSQAT